MKTDTETTTTDGDKTAAIRDLATRRITQIDARIAEQEILEAGMRE